jgi:uncharacterized membrane protein YqjE
LKTMLSQALELLQLRVELLSTELQAEKLRIFAGLIYGLMAMLLGAASVGLVSVGLVLLTPVAWRWLGALGLGVLYLGLAWLCIRQAVAQISQVGGAFAGTAAELARDRKALED